MALAGGIPGTSYPGLEEATGRGGDLSITTDLLTVQDGAIIATGSFRRLTIARGAGNLNVTAQRIHLDQAGLFANTNSGNGGDLNLNIQDLLVLQQGSQISTTAGLSGTGGNGGNIQINTNGFIVATPAAPSTSNDITANAFEGNGGNVDITAQLTHRHFTPNSPHPRQRYHRHFSTGSQWHHHRQHTHYRPDPGHHRPAHHACGCRSTDCPRLFDRD